ncbi:MAG: hypothetical protein R3B55_03105 [Candidatus Paceibacterota bacterium]
MSPRGENLLQTASELLPAFLNQNKKFLGGREGGCLAILDKFGSFRETIHLFDIGEIPLGKLNEKRAFAKEKVFRVTHMNETHKHLTSFESENSGNRQYGGGIKMDDGLFVSFSGFPAHLDQDFVILAGLFSYEMTLEQAIEIRKRTIDKYPRSFFTER